VWVATATATLAGNSTFSVRHVCLRMITYNFHNDGVQVNISKLISRYKTAYRFSENSDQHSSGIRTMYAIF